MTADGRSTTGRESGARLAQKLAIVTAVVGLGVLIASRAEHAVRAPFPPRFTPSDPLNERGLAQLGFLADRRGERARAKTLLQLAGRVGWRDPQVQAWLLQRAVETGDWAAATAHADALLRTDGDGVLRPAVFRLLDVIAADETARPALIARLRHRPWWRESWLAHLAKVATSSADGVGPETARSIVMALGSGPWRLSPVEYLPYVEMRLARGDYDEAKRDWAVLAGSPDAGALLRDPAFQTLGGKAPFDWRRASGPGASSDVESTDGASADLRVDYDGVSSADLPGQLLVLRPGRYSFSWRERIAGPPRLVWRVRCLGPAPRTLAEESPVDVAGWRSGVLTFELTQNCPAQELELIPHPGERRVETTAWFANPALSRRS